MNFIHINITYLTMNLIGQFPNHAHYARPCIKAWLPFADRLQYFGGCYSRVQFLPFLLTSTEFFCTIRCLKKLWLASDTTLCVLCKMVKLASFFVMQKLIYFSPPSNINNNLSQEVATTPTKIYSLTIYKPCMSLKYFL